MRRLQRCAHKQAEHRAYCCTRVSDEDYSGCRSAGDSSGKNSCMSTSIYVSNLAAVTTKEVLATKFSEFGTVLSVKLGRDSETGQARGYGFVEMKTSDEARLAARSMNATRLDGRLLSVNRAARS